MSHANDLEASGLRGPFERLALRSFIIGGCGKHSIFDWRPQVKLGRALELGKKPGSSIVNGLLGWPNKQSDFPLI
jgi:hypothetical protein